MSKAQGEADNGRGGLEDWNMKLEDFVKEQKQWLDLFEAAWKREHALRPDVYPMFMPPGEWDE